MPTIHHSAPVINLAVNKLPSQLELNPDNAGVSALKDHDPRVGQFMTGTDPVTHEPMTAWFVDGEWLRTNIWQDWIAGGTWGRYPTFTPKNEVWIDEACIKEAKFILIHEMTELLKMRDDGLAYVVAHSQYANVAEWEARHNPDKVGDMLRAQGWNCAGL